MLAKKKAAKKSAIAGHSSAMPSTLSASPATKDTGKKKTAKAAKAAADSHRRPLTRADVQDVSTEADKVDLIRSIGDNINTRLLNIHSQSRGGDDDMDDIDDAVLHEEKKYQLMEEARLAAGMQQRVVSSHIAEYYGQGTTEDQLALVRVKHNCNAITAVAALGLDVLVLGDKSGRVYMMDLNPIPDAPSLFASQRAEKEGQETKGKGNTNQKEVTSSSPRVDLHAYRRTKKMMLEPALPKAIVSVAISDTRGNRPTTRDLFERTTVDHSCPSYTVAGAEDGSIAVWETFTQKHKGLLFMHRKAVTGLSFRTNTADLYSASDDGTLRVWSVPQMMSVDKLFGHEGKIHDLRALKKETCATVGDDGTMRFWKIDAATQQSYTYTLGQREEALAAGASAGELVLVNDDGAGAAGLTDKARATAIQLECVAMVNESTVLCGAVDGALVLFDVNKRKPLAIVPAAHGFDALQDGTGLERTALQQEHLLRKEEHSATAAADAAVRALLGPEAEEAKSSKAGKAKGRKGGGAAAASAPAARAPRVYDRRRVPNAISAVAAVPYADVVASASYDGVVRLWRVRGVGAGAAAGGRRTALAGDAAQAQERDTPGLALLAELPVHALVTSLHFSPDGDCLYVGSSKECRRGRWMVYRAAQNGVAVIPLTTGGARQFLLTSASADGTKANTGPSVLSIEHVPAQLYSFLDDNLEDDKSENGNEEENGSSAAGAQSPAAKRGTSKKPLPADDLEVEFLDSEEDVDEEGLGHGADLSDDEQGDVSGAFDLRAVGKRSPKGDSAAKRGSNGGAFFTVGADGQLMFSSSAPSSSSAPPATGDVMRAKPAGSALGGLKKKAKKLIKSASAADAVTAAVAKKAKKAVVATPSPSASPMKKEASPSPAKALKKKKKKAKK